MEEQKVVVEAVTNVQIKVDYYLVDNNVVRFEIQSTFGWVNIGRKIFILDHRPATLQAVKSINSGDSWGDYCKAEKTLIEVVRQPARAIVTEEMDRGETFPYVNLYPANGQKPMTLLSETSYIGISKGSYSSGFEIKENNALWNQTSMSSSRTGEYRVLVLVALTDRAHKIIIKSYGCPNIGYTDKNITVIGDDIRQMSEEDL